MPEHIRALIVIFVFATLIFSFVRQAGVAQLCQGHFIFRRRIWYAITLIAFISYNYWIFILFAGLLLIFTIKRETNYVALFFFLIFAVPLGKLPVPGFGLVNYLFELNYQRFLVITLLLPAYLKLISNKSTPSFGRFLPDKILFCLLLLTIILQLRDSSITHTLRFGLIQFLDIFLPYFVISRSLSNVETFKDVFASFLIAILILSIIGAFEMIRHWHLYSGVARVLDIASGASYLDRAGLLRARASLERIPLGLTISVGIGFFIYLMHYIKSSNVKLILSIILLIGIISPLSRGPWVGAAAIIISYLIFQGAFRKLFLALFLCTISLGVIVATPLGDKVIGLIPFVGDIESGNISYRKRLLENSIIVIKRNPLLGSVNYLETAEMQEMVQGQGIIDIVNTYLRVSLEYGLTGLTLFTGFFIVIFWRIRIKAKAISRASTELSQLGYVIASTMLGILVTIGTVSSTSIIPLLYWSIGAMGVGYSYILVEPRKKNTV